MKRVRCPKCDNFITFDETQYQPGQSLVFQCPECNKQFGIRMGDNVIGRYMKGNPRCNTPIETVDPSVDTCHCVIQVSRDKKGRLRHILRDGPSNTGTFVDNQILGDRERRIITDGTLFTIGATSIILRLSQD